MSNSLVNKIKMAKKAGLIIVAIVFLTLIYTGAYALNPDTTLDWSTVSLSGTNPDFSFTHSALGNVSLTYSNNSVSYGIWDTLFVEPTLRLGMYGGEWLSMSWSNPVTNFNMEIWDIDAQPGEIGEEVTFVTNAIISIVALHPTDIWNPATQILSSDGTINYNSEEGNFTILNFANPSGFDTITFNWEISGSAGGMGIGTVNDIFIVPEPVSFALFIIGGATLGLRRFKRRKFRK